LTLLAVDAKAAMPFLVTRGELAMMPPYCTAIYERLLGGPETANHPLRNTIPNCSSVHHYCDGLKYVIRTNGAWNNPNDAKYYYQKAEQSFRSVIDEWKTKAPDCSLYPEAYTNLGNHLLNGSKHAGDRVGEALTNYENATQKNKNYVPAYIGLANAHLKYKDKDKAMKALERGIRHNPESKPLAKKYQELGGKLESLLADMPAPSLKQADSPPAQATDKPDDKKAAPKTSKPEVNVIIEKKDESQSVPKKTGTPANPWCRFCPDTNPVKDK